MNQTSVRTLVFVGLGNPGPAYAKTRHNMGYLVVQALAEKIGWHFKLDRRFNALVAKGSQGEITLHLLLPTTFMNVSGVAVKSYLDFFKLSPRQIVVAVDDVALPFGQMRLKMKGSAGGHNGLKSLEAHLGTADYVRLRMGIGHPGESALVDYVLDLFSQKELEQLPAVVDRGVDVLKSLLTKSVEQVMNQVNTTSQSLLKERELGLEKLNKDEKT